MPAAVVNASPLIFLAKLGRIDALTVFEPVLTTPEAFGEVTAGLALGYRDALAVHRAVDTGALTVRKAARLRAPPVGLDIGELSVLGLAATLPGSTAILDDLAAIKAARGMGLRARSTPFVLLDNVDAGRLTRMEFRQLLDALVGHGYFMGPAPYNRLAEAARGP